MMRSEPFSSVSSTVSCDQSSEWEEEKESQEHDDLRKREEKVQKLELDEHRLSSSTSENSQHEPIEF